ncbi:hypothetical protein [Pseudobacteriovorax antillogorgiicola]|uniref:Uncharacterized protein n=1 Tax=Pseudobacteriovorax antillogorgiicola TaxID=1513793 RepID=A0A1Y6C9W1_9BACT|nr:hypothetical protein [Pseudobacteriovorax antillogorgiicola]TCS49856.1 hypothetical protein EDD56_114101 [Pseudobacteriovorax antillogorgiicola]SMF43762.1 hypothetical protein SAMN06296036_113100 [Pseudobacteriovorax antillogorgiicola]
MSFRCLKILGFLVLGSVSQVGLSICLPDLPIGFKPNKKDLSLSLTNMQLKSQYWGPGDIKAPPSKPKKKVPAAVVSHFENSIRIWARNHHPNEVISIRDQELKVDTCTTSLYYLRFSTTRPQQPNACYGKYKYRRGRVTETSFYCGPIDSVHVGNWVEIE